MIEEGTKERMKKTGRITCSTSAHHSRWTACMSAVPPPTGPVGGPQDKIPHPIWQRIQLLICLEERRGRMMIDEVEEKEKRSAIA